jgi:predicted RNA binding protein YcfA (HicA-like mRNA interferase family)
MPTREELYERLLRQRKGRVSPEFFRRTAEKWGYTFRGTKGSHMQFFKLGQPILTAKIMHGRHVHPAANEELLERIEEEIKEGR